MTEDRDSDFIVEVSYSVGGCGCLRLSTVIRVGLHVRTSQWCLRKVLPLTTYLIMDQERHEAAAPSVGEDRSSATSLFVDPGP